MAAYVVLSPDGVPIRARPFATRAAAERAVVAFAARYVAQGYYAGVDGIIPLEELPGRCRIVSQENRRPARNARAT